LASFGLHTLAPKKALSRCSSVVGASTSLLSSLLSPSNSDSDSGEVGKGSSKNIILASSDALVSLDAFRLLLFASFLALVYSFSALTSLLHIPLEIPADFF
jgi:hypothetical protein